MKIVIVGAGRVGTTLAQHLSGESNDISVIDFNEKNLYSIIRATFEFKFLIAS